MSTNKWYKSSYSNPNGNCVELTTILDELRDSKDPNGPTLKINVTKFIREVKADRYEP